MDNAAEIEDLKRRVEMLEGRLATLSAFALAVLTKQSDPLQVLNEMSDQIGPCLHVLASLSDRHAYAAAHLSAFLAMPDGGLASAPPFEG